MDVLELAEDHPLATAGVVFVGGLVVLYMLGWIGGGSSSSSGNSGLAQAYYAAEAAQTTAGTQLAIVQANNTAASAIAQIQAGRDTAINQAWSTAQTQQTALTTAAQTNQALYSAETSTLAGLLSTGGTGAGSSGTAGPSPYATGSYHIAGSIGGNAFDLSQAQGGQPTPSQLLASGFTQQQITDIGKMYGW